MRHNDNNSNGTPNANIWNQNGKAITVKMFSQYLEPEKENNQDVVEPSTWNVVPCINIPLFFLVIV